MNNEAERFYFDHSYHMCCDRELDVAATFEYGTSLCCAVSAGNIHGAQFHPEKSHRFGMRLLGAYAALSKLEAAAA
jgi:glutamine amidotransferase